MWPSQTEWAAISHKMMFAGCSRRFALFVFMLTVSLCAYDWPPLAVFVCVRMYVCMRDKETGREADSERVVRFELLSSLVACHGLMHSLLAHSHCIKSAQHTHTHIEWHKRFHFYCALITSLFSVSQCHLRSWFDRGTRSQLRVAPWPSSAAPKETLRLLSFGKKKAAR